MKRCPITYQEIPVDINYSQSGLRLLSRSLKDLNKFPFTPQVLIQKALDLASKTSIQGVQAKLSIKLKVKNESFEIVERKGQYILKPPHQIYEEVSENEDLTMRLAGLAGIDVPFHGLIYNADDSLSYIVKRFDRERNQKIAVEDFSQLLGFSRDDKYDSSMEQIVKVIEKHCTFPAIEKAKLFRLTLFNFLVGNEDMHLKNFMLIRHQDKVELSPAYDLLNTTILFDAKEEVALPINGKKSKLTRNDFVDYFGEARLGLPRQLLEDEVSKLRYCSEQWNALIDISFLSLSKRERYKSLIEGRWQRLMK